MFDPQFPYELHYVKDGDDVAERFRDRAEAETRRAQIGALSLAKPGSVRLYEISRVRLP